MNSLEVYSIRKYIILCILGALLITISIITLLPQFIAIWIVIELYGIWGLSKYSKNRNIFWFYQMSYLFLLLPLIFLLIGTKDDLATESILFADSVFSVLIAALFVVLIVLSSYYRYKSLSLIGDEFSNNLFKIASIFYPFVLFSVPFKFINTIFSIIFLIILVTCYTQIFFSIKSNLK